MRPFGCPVTILNIIDHLGKFNGKADEGFFVGYSLYSKAFKVFNSRIRIVEENLHIRFSESTPNVIGTQSNGFTDPKSSHDDGSKPSSDNGKKVDEDPRKENECNDQEKEDNVNSTNNVNTISSTVNAVGTNKDNELPFDPNMPALEDVNTFNFLSDDEDDRAMADMNNLDTIIQVSPIPTTRIHKDHLLDQIEEEVYVCQPPGFEDSDFLLEYTRLKKHYMDYIKLLELGLQVKQKKDGIFISQDKYVTEILKKFRFTKVKTSSTPMETQKPLLKNEDGKEVYVHMYRLMIGSLMYLTPSRLDIMFAIPQPSDPMEHVANEAVHKELGDSLVRAATTVSSLEAEQDNGNINKTQSKATPNESSSQRTDSGGGPRVLELEKIKTSQHNEIASLKRKVKKLKKRNRLRTHKLKRLCKVDLTARVESSDNKKVWVRMHPNRGGGLMLLINIKRLPYLMFKMMQRCLDLGGGEVFVAEQEVVKDVNENVVEEVVNAAQDSTATTTITIEEITLAQALEALKISKRKVKGTVIQEQEDPEPVKPKKKDQIRLDEEVAKRLQAEFDEKEDLQERELKKNKKLILP
nr:ribonuclease H-like domain, reverse transcriptase, RNA-dependent DNA polymerase [Tanacetum cinerariifolium]